MPTRVLVSAAMIRLRVKEAALKRGIKNAYQLAQRMDNVSGKPPEPRTEEVARRLWKGKVQPKMDTLDLVAGALGDCDLSELLVRIPNRHTKTSPPKRSSKTLLSAATNGSAKKTEQRNNHRRNGAG